MTAIGEILADAHQEGRLIVLHSSQDHHSRAQSIFQSIHHCPKPFDIYVVIALNENTYPVNFLNLACRIIARAACSQLAL